ncbi:LPXTG-motif cell wall anchor domain protein [Brevibacterium mcbrellneri ATCC 49030]|uniref:LPXTG-motif cell wall anchor domain protein n=1 Tax=Brevibacterium mcbrellneri ATCC 49030 TaxID=585530 RepID=D4YPQ3_9MICO|nr:hypothetical protein [Brevibacterium mcbrellneri]EFG46788.1 LPXTG-motif cell wall anchor domain protein [Brevibacterium mcbrellneri ATCC 49030]
MKKFFALAAVICLGLVGSVISTVTPVHADSRRVGFCLNDSRLFDISPSPVTEGQLKQSGAEITVNAKGLPPNTLGVVLVVKDKLLTPEDLMRTRFDGDIPEHAQGELKALQALNLDYSEPALYLFNESDRDPNLVARKGYVVTDGNGDAAFTFGGTKDSKEEPPLTREQKELVTELDVKPWSSSLPKIDNGDYRGDYTVLVAFYNADISEPYGVVFDENNTLIPAEGMELDDQKHEAVIKQRENRLREAGVPEDQIDYLARLIMPSACTGFNVTDTPTETPEPTPSESATPTPEPSATPSESPSVDPEPSPSPSETSPVEPEPTPEPSETPEPKPSESPDPEPSPSPSETSPVEPSPGPKSLPRTGAQTLGALVAGGVLLTVGTVTTVLSRRRSR